MAEPHCHLVSETTRRKGPDKRGNIPVEVESVLVPEVSPAPAAPCGACKFLRRKCISGCIFAPHFGSDQGAAKFAAVHKVFGASNVSKLLLHIPVNRRHDAVVTISYEAQARLSDPVYGCVSTILSLQQQVASLQAELVMVQNQLINSRFAMVNALQSSQQQQHHHNHQQHEQHIPLLRPAYSNNSSASNNLINISNFASNFELVSETTTTAPNSSQSMDHLQLSMPFHDDEDDEQDSRIPPIYANQIIHST
ncbi:LOB domain-containing protein 20 [Hibiscus syriacus]|uniref:LOB domain-containing protein 20 n=1 Tax=Hibiscus syriacus TaxID=106335 RepID=A0A6A2Y5I1_HIBSY|nr:LOB domain-containing protein 20-like [Hibiscus syriacus]KAE8664124.1 LOB domain-containing protein 20 [Hibiscus syriacus]